MLSRNIALVYYISTIIEEHVRQEKLPPAIAPPDVPVRVRTLVLERNVNLSPIGGALDQ